ncbi:unnamed protein product [Aphanomyces euteiches]
MAYDELHKKVVMFGGKSNTGTLLDETWLWDGAKDEQTWAEVTGLNPNPPARLGAGIAYDPISQKVIMFGGEGAAGVLNDTWLWNGVKWTKANVSGPSVRSGVQMAYDGHQIVLFGGYTLSGGKKIPIGETWIWDGANWLQQQPSVSPPNMHSGGMAYDGQHAVIYGGDLGESLHTANGNTYDDSSYALWVWDGQTKSWSQKNGPGDEEYGGRWGNATAYDGRRVVTFSGEWDYFNPPVNQLKLGLNRPSNLVRELEGGYFAMAFGWKSNVWDAWRPKTNQSLPQDYADGFPVSRSYTSMAFDGHNFVLFGGLSNYYGVMGETWTFGSELPTLPDVAISGAPDPIFRSQSTSQYDEASILYDVTVNDISPLTERGIEYRIYAPDGQPQTGWTRASLMAGSVKITSPGFKTQNIANLTWNTDYELRAYGVNGAGTRYSTPVRFKLDNDTTLTPPAVHYDRVGPSFLYVEDKKRISVVGTTISNLLRKPLGGIDYYLQGTDGVNHPLAYQIVSDNELKLTWTDNLPPDAYDVKLHHAFFTTYDFPQAVTITAAKFYKPRNFGTVEVDSTSPANEVDKLTLRGPFVEMPATPSLYQLNDPAEPVVINDSVLFKGTTLEVDKRTSPYTIRGNGRLYVNSAGTSPAGLSYTLVDGQFELNANNFSITVPNNQKIDYSGMGFPVNAKSIVFTQAGVRLAGTIDLGSYVGSNKIDGTTNLDKLTFDRNRFNLTGGFTTTTPFAVGPLDVTGTKWNIDSRFGYADAVASARLPDYEMNFEMNMGFKQNRLDSIGFGMNKSATTKISGTKLTNLYGKVSGLSSNSQLPQTFRFKGAATDVFAPELNKLHLIEAYDMNIDLARNGYTAGGSMYLYWFKVEDLKQLVSLNRQIGFMGMKSSGFGTTGSINAFDVLAGPMALSYANNVGFSGQMKATVKIPNNIPAVGGKTVQNAIVTLDAKGLYSSFKINDIGVNVTYLFSKNIFEFNLIAPPPPPYSGLLDGLGVLEKISGIGGALTGNPLDVLEFFGDLFGLQKSEFKKDDKSRLVKVASLNEMQYGLKQISASMHPSKEEVASAIVRLDSSRFTAIVRDQTPDAKLLASDPDGNKVAYTFNAERPYEAMLVLEGDHRDVRLSDLDGRIVKPDSVNAIFRGGMTYFRVSLNRAGAWKLKAPEAVRFTMYVMTYFHASDDISTLTDAWTEASDRDVTLLPLKQTGRTLLTISGSWGKEVVYKPDGRPYALETDTLKPDWNAYRDPSNGLLYVLADVAETGDWFVDGGGHAEVNAYNVKPETTMANVQEWMQRGVYPSRVNIAFRTNSQQALLYIYGADAGTTVLRPDGSEYELHKDYNQLNWNAYYNENLKLLTVLLNSADVGEWTVKSGSFTNIRAYEASVPFDNLRPLYLKGDWTSTMQLKIAKPGKYLLTVIGGDENTKVTAPHAASPMTLVFDDNNPARNAIMQRWEDRQQTDDGQIIDADFVSNIPDPGEADVLYVTLNAKQAGTWSIKSNAKLRLKLTELPEAPELAEVSASLAGTNRFDVQWNVKNAKPDTRVTVMVTDNPEQPFGKVVADNLPAAGVSMIDIPSGFVPGHYYLSVLATGTSWAPMTHVIPQAIELTSAQTLPKPQTPELLSTGNGEVTLQLQPVDDTAVSRYRVFVLDSNGVPDYSQPAFDASADESELVMAGLETGQTYRFAVMAIGEKAGETVFSPLSESVEVQLPVPHPADLNVGLTAVSPVGSSVVELTYRTFRDEEETTLITSAEAASVQVKSSQNAQVALYVNGEFIVRQHVAANGTTNFDLNALLDKEMLTERDYALWIESVNDTGDHSSIYRKLDVDRTGPQLYVAYVPNPEEGLNGLVLNAKRLPLIGQTDVGSTLTLNGARVPLDEPGRFDYYAPWPDNGNGVYDVDMVAEDQAGNRTEYKFQVLQSTAGHPLERNPAELAALTLDRGGFTVPFHPDTTSYVTKLEEGKVKVFAVPASSGAVVTVNGKSPDTDGAVETDIPAAGGVLSIHVAGSGGSEKTYTVQLNNKLSDAALLSNLVVSADEEEVPLSLEFSGATENYEAVVGNKVSEVTVLPTALRTGSIIRVNGNSVPTGASALVELQAGVATPVEISITSPDGEAIKTYTLNVWRKANSDAELQQLSIQDRQLIPQFSREITDYRVVVPAEATSVQVAAQSAGMGAVVSINGEERQALEVQLTQNVQDIDVAVAAQDGTLRNYHITVAKQLAETAKPPILEKLYVINHYPLPEFSPYRFSYSAGQTSSDYVRVGALAADSNAFVTVNGRAVDNSGLLAVPLAVGQNSILVDVESADRKSSQTYSIALNRWVPSPSKPNAEVPSNVRMVAVETSDSASAATVAVPIVRSQAANGAKIDSVYLDKKKVKEIVDKTKASKSDYARIVITDLPADPAQEVHVDIPATSVEDLAAGRISLQISTPDAEIVLSADTIAKMRDAGKDLYFRIVPINDEQQRNEVETRTVQAEIVRTAAGGNRVALLGKPMIIETNFKDFSSSIIFPLKGLVLPQNEEEAKRLLTELAVYIEHSDGEKVVQRGEIQYGKDGKPNGIRIEVNKFSTFSIIRMSGTAETAKWLPYISGYPDGSFRPEHAITRAELATVLSRILKQNSGNALAGNEKEYAVTGPYPDVSADHWAASAIALMKSKGIMNGDTAGNFKPEQVVTRAEMAAVAVRWEKLGSSGKADFSDTKGHWAAGLIASTQAAGLMVGYKDGTFRPNAPLLRSEAVKVLNQMSGRPVPSEQTGLKWLDVSEKHWAQLQIESASSIIRVYSDGTMQISKP